MQERTRALIWFFNMWSDLPNKDYAVVVHRFGQSLAVLRVKYCLSSIHTEILSGIFTPSFEVYDRRTFAALCRNLCPTTVQICETTVDFAHMNIKTCNGNLHTDDANLTDENLFRSKTNHMFSLKRNPINNIQLKVIFCKGKSSCTPKIRENSTLIETTLH